VVQLCRRFRPTRKEVYESDTVASDCRDRVFRSCARAGTTKSDAIGELKNSRGEVSAVLRPDAEAACCFGGFLILRHPRPWQRFVMYSEIQSIYKHCETQTDSGRLSGSRRKIPTMVWPDEKRVPYAAIRERMADGSAGRRMRRIKGARHAHAVIRASGRIPGAEGGRRSRPIESKGVKPRFEEEVARAALWAG
jgi:hypothetical protein